jgi:lysozyme
LSRAEIDLLLANDIQEKIAGMRTWRAREWVRDDPVRSATLVAMTFQFGTAKLAKFTDTLDAVGKASFGEAALAMLDSLWARQTPARAYRVAAMMRSSATISPFVRNEVMRM